MSVEAGVKTAIVWFRRDLRLHDNLALVHAARSAERVIPVYIHAPGEDPAGAAANCWLHASLARLHAALSALGAPLVIRSGGSIGELRRLARECGAHAVYWNRLPEPHAAARDARVAEALREAAIESDHFPGALLAEPGSLRNASGQPYRVFTPFWHALGATLPARAPVAAPRALRGAAGVRSLPLDELGLKPPIRWDAGIDDDWTPGEEAALARLRRFAAAAAGNYPRDRDRPDLDGTSRLSPHLHFGELTPAQVAARLARTALEEPSLARGTQSVLRQLGWRDFAHHLLRHFPDTPSQPLQAAFASYPWRRKRDYAADLVAWQRGQTGIPLVDAGMRQLWTTGWMHNRVRMVVASFLTKNLRIPWQEGAGWFLDTLVDADLANNTLGWQWVAGSGADAAPYFRVFNPVLQSRKFDPQAQYLARWVPELASLAPGARHAPWLTGGAPGYPDPIVDLGASRNEALEAYRRMKGG